MARIVAGEHQLGVRALGQHLGEGLDQKRKILIGLPLAEIQQEGRPDAEVVLPGRLGPRIAAGGKACVSTLRDRLQPLRR